MSGRHAGRGRGRGCGSGRGFSKNRKNTNYNQDSDKKEMKFIPKGTGKVQGYTYETVKEYILHELQKELEYGKDIATNLRKGEDTGITLEQPIRLIAQKVVMTAAEWTDPTASLIREDYAKEQRIVQ